MEYVELWPLDVQLIDEPDLHYLRDEFLMVDSDGKPTEANVGFPVAMHRAGDAMARLWLPSEALRDAVARELARPHPEFPETDSYYEYVWRGAPVLVGAPETVAADQVARWREKPIHGALYPHPDEVTVDPGTVYHDGPDGIEPIDVPEPPQRIYTAKRLVTAGAGAGAGYLVAGPPGAVAGAVIGYVFGA